MSDLSFPFAPQQVAALDAIGKWLKAGWRTKPIFRLFGYAGTGKTSIAKAVASLVDGEVAYAAFSGKAALVMAKNGCDSATTIHNLIYTPRVMSDGSVRYIVNRKGRAATAGLIVIDEASMVNETVARDLLSFRCPILVIGDPAQLPPPDGAGYFTKAQPDIMLTEIHRQAADNPIIRMATDVRERGVLMPGKYGSSSVLRLHDLTDEMLLAADQVLVGKNATRQRLNATIRELRGFAGADPVVGEKLVCLRNNHDLGLLNGGMFSVAKVHGIKPRSRHLKLDLLSDDFPDLFQDELRVERHGFENPALTLEHTRGCKGEFFDYGYALMVHKAQGSQWSSVLIYDESGVFKANCARWLYTAITRASERAAIILPF